MMRLYEFSKKNGIPSKELMAVLANKGMVVKSHMIVLTDEMLRLLEGYVEKKARPAPEPAKKNDQYASTTKKTAGSDSEVNLNTAPAASSHSTKTVHSRLASQQPTATASLRSSSPPKRFAHKKSAPKPPTSFVVEPMTVGQLAERVGRPASEIIVTLLKQGMMCTINYLLSVETVEQIANSYGLELIFPKDAKKQEHPVALSTTEASRPRLPVVVVVGHVDHGKTTLLDHIRKTRVAAKEKGGITQHLGAYRVNTSHGGIIFLDTPGHAAFTKIRGRGLSVADIAVLVVAADDSVKPQTNEAIRQAQEGNVPIIVAINKVDRVDETRIEKVKQDLVKYGLVPEDWGGETVMVPISAKQGANIEQLLEMIALQAELMELKARMDVSARGFVLESRLEKGRGPVATIILNHGALSIADYVASGHVVGRVNSMLDSRGRRLTNVGPSEPVIVAGFDRLPDVGSPIEVVPKEKYAALKGVHQAPWSPGVSRGVAEDALNIIVKADTESSKEALIDALQKLITNEPRLSIVYSGVGDVNESDITLATDTGSHIYGLHVKMEPNALPSAKHNMVPIHLYHIIYKFLEDVQSWLERSKIVEKETVKVGQATVRRVFKIKGVGVVAGCYVNDGRIVRNGKMVIYRGDQKIGEGSIKSLQRENKTVKEVATGYECAFLVDGFDNWQVDDTAQCFIEQEKK